MLAWKTFDSLGNNTMGWQPFDSRGEPAAEARYRGISNWDDHLWMRHFPDGRIYIDVLRGSRGLAVDGLGVPEAGLDSLEPFVHSFVYDSARHRYYGIDYNKILAYDGKAALLGTKGIDVTEAT